MKKLRYWTFDRTAEFGAQNLVTASVKKVRKIILLTDSIK